jgi:hypothetical protein
MDARTYCALVGGSDNPMLESNTESPMTARHHRLAYVPDREMDRTTLQRAGQLAAALEDLYELLEEYAPAWYTQEHREKAEAALRMIKGS